MVDINAIWNVFIGGLNTQYSSYTYLKANQKGPLPPYPYVTINCLTPYKKDMDIVGGTKIRQTVNNKVQVISTEQPKMIFSIMAYSDNLSQCLQVLRDTLDWIKTTNQQYLRKRGIVVVDVGNVGDRSVFLEVDYQYCWGFDTTIRVFDSVTTEINPIDSVEITGNDNELIDI